MRLCVPVPCFFRNTEFPDAIRKIGELGFTAAETYNWKSLDLDAVRAACEESGVELVSMCTTEFRMTDPQYRDLWLAGLAESCVAARRVGATRLITQVGQDTGAPREAQHEAIVKTLEAAKPILDEHGISHHLVYVDDFEGEQRRELMAKVRSWNPRGSFPTLVLPDGRVSVGFREAQVRKLFDLA